MKITLVPQKRIPYTPMTLSKAGDVLTINGEAFDFSVVPDGATLPADAIDCEYIVEDVRRVDGDLQVTLVFPIGSTASSAAKFPQPIINPMDGNVELPK